MSARRQTGPAALCLSNMSYMTAHHDATIKILILKNTSNKVTQQNIVQHDA